MPEKLHGQDEELQLNLFQFTSVENVHFVYIICCNIKSNYLYSLQVKVHFNSVSYVTEDSLRFVFFISGPETRVPPPRGSQFLV